MNSPKLVGRGKPIDDTCECSTIISERDADAIGEVIGNPSFEEAKNAEELQDRIRRAPGKVLPIPAGTDVPGAYPLWWVTKTAEVIKNERFAPRHSGIFASAIRDNLGLSPNWTGGEMYELRFSPGPPKDSLLRCSVFDGAFRNTLYRPCVSDHCGGWGKTIHPKTLEPVMSEAIVQKPGQFDDNTYLGYIGEVIQDRAQVDPPRLEAKLKEYYSTL